MKKKIALIALITIGVLIILTAWIILFGFERSRKKLSVSDDEIIVLGDESFSSDENKEALPEVEDNEYGEVLPDKELTEEDKSLIERLSAVDGMCPGADTGWIFVGDSRFVNMNTVCNISKNDNLFMVAKVGEGYAWFTNSALQQIKRITSSGLFNKWKLIICLGINDLGSRENMLKSMLSLRMNMISSLFPLTPLTITGTFQMRRSTDLIPR